MQVRPSVRASAGVGACIVGLLWLTGCTPFGFDVRSFPQPVMVSPILRVGDTAPTALTAPSIGRVRGEASTSSAAGAGSHYERRGGDVYQVSQSYHGIESSDNVFRALADATGRRSDVFVVVDELTVRHLTHMSMIGYVAMESGVEGHVYEDTAIRDREERP